VRKLIGRFNELKVLNGVYESNKSEFVAVYGRRRVGKTFLIRSVFDSRLFFVASGIQGGDEIEQINNFNREMRKSSLAHVDMAKTWIEVFENLLGLIELEPKLKKKVIFLDEISWMAAGASGFISALDYFWNRWISARDDVLLIVCGSATTWIIDNIVNNVGGLHNRLTCQIQLAPFTLKECEHFFIDSGIQMPRYQIIETYMVFGGIPYYLDLFRADRSLAQNIDLLYFAPDAPLKNEYQNLYHALFDNAEHYIKVIEALSSKKMGLLRSEISEKTKISTGGTLSRILSDLVNCGFIQEYYAFGKQKRGKLYQLMDPFTLFHLTFFEKQRRFMENYWLHYSVTPAHSAWSGYAFEQVCFLHISQIKKGLGISGMLTETSAWRSKESNPGVQIDLLMDRSDKMIHLCEMKFSATEYTVSKAYSAKLREKKAVFMRETKTRKMVHIAMITTYGLVRNAYSSEILFQLTMDDLFE